MSGGERVEDTRTLQVGDRVRVEVEGVVTSVLADEFTIAHGRGGDPRPGMPGLAVGDRRSLDGWFVHGQPQTTVYRVPKPLPPEPPIGAEVLGQDGEIRFRRTGTGWCSLRRCVQACDLVDSHEEWRDVLVTFGPLRLLGDPIEAPR